LRWEGARRAVEVGEGQGVRLLSGEGAEGG